MDETEIAVALAELKKEMGSAKHRIADLEEDNKAMQDLVISVRELALNAKNTTEELKKQGKRLDALEREPADRWKDLVKTLITVAVSGITGALITGLLTLI